jgi:transposase
MKRGKGARPKLMEEHIVAIEEWIQQDPSEHGYKQTTWTCKMLADYLKKKHGLEISQERIRQVLHTRGLSYKKPELQPPTASAVQKKSP